MEPENPELVKLVFEQPLGTDELEASACIIDHEDDIDWENIAATTEDDFKAGRYAFTSEDYATHEEATAAMSAWIDPIFDEVLRRVASNSSLHAKGSARH